MATQEDAPAPSPPSKPKVSPLRNMLALALLIMLLFVVYREFSARRNAGAACQSLERALAKEEGDLMTMQQVQDMIGHAADGPVTEEGMNLKVTYTWQGVFRSYVMTATYKKGREPGLLSIACK